MPLPKRPSKVEIVEAVERERGQIMVWVDAGGKTIALQFSDKAIANRKLVYGLARLVVEYLDGRPDTTSIEDLVPDADDKAIAHLIEEHFDRFDEHQVDWRQQAWAPRFSTAPPHPDHIPRPDLHKTHTLKKTAPTPFDKQPHTRLVMKRSQPKGASPVVVDVVDKEGA